MDTTCTDASLTLEEALDLLDSVDVVPSLDFIDCEPPAVSTSSSSNASTQTRTTSTRMKRVRNPLDDVRRRQRRKEERQQLKDEVKQYEAVVELLTLSRQRRTIGNRLLAVQEQESPLMRSLTGEAYQRRKAEETNAKLKALLVERLQAAEAIRDVLLRETMLLANIDSVVGRSLPQLPERMHSTNATALQLRMAISGIFDSTDDVFGSFASRNLDSMESISRVRQQSQSCGACIELLSTTPLSCDFAAAKNCLWEVITEKQWPGTQSAFRLQTKETTLESVEFGFSIEFDDLEGVQVALDGVTFLQRRDEEHRTILVWTSIIEQEPTQLRFQSQGWIVVMKSRTEPQTASVVRTCCRISVKSDDEHYKALGGHDDSFSRKLQNAILRWMGQRVKCRVESVQQKLLERVGTPGSEALIFI